MGVCCGSANRGVQTWSHMKRPFNDLKDKQEMMDWNQKEYAELQKVGEDGVNFAGKTAFMVAYERMIESERPAHIRLFNDYLAKHFCGGEVGKKVSESMAFGLKMIFDPEDKIGLGYEGHVNYTAARTQLVSDKLNAWIDSTSGKKQVLDMGCGMTTRVYWDENLKKVDNYIEVDQIEVCDSKTKILDGLKAKGELKPPMCQRDIIKMDYLKESTKDIASKGFNKEVPTCWILEGLVMYLTKDVVDQLLKELSDLSPKGSYIILNFFAAAPGSIPANLDAPLIEAGWTKEETLMFGDKAFNYGKYPLGKPANAMMGFSFWRK